MAVPRDLAQEMGLVQALAMVLGLATEAGPAPALVMALEMAMEKVLAEALQKGLKSYQEPVYPSAARSAGISGTTVVGFIIEADGSVSSAWVEQSSGNSSLDSAAVQSVQNWRFVPAR